MQKTEQIEIRRGLKDVYLDTTEASFIDGEIGKLLYRGYSIHDLAEQSTFEEVSYLLLYGRLPTRAELEAFDAGLRADPPGPRPKDNGPRLLTDPKQSLQSLPGSSRRICSARAQACIVWK